VEQLRSDDAARERQIEEKIEEVVEELEEIEELIREDGHDRSGDHGHERRVRPSFYVDIEGKEYPWHAETITVAQIRELGGLPPDQPVIEVDRENQERTLGNDEVVHLKPGHRYGKKVRYKRGLGDRIAAELDLLRQFFPQAEWHEAGAGEWVKIPDYPLPPGIWNREHETVCFEVPPAYPGQAPYAFCVTAGLRLRHSTGLPQNYQEGAATPFPGSWGRFSWAHDGTWRPTADLSSGSNLSNFVLTFADRLKEAS